MGQTCGPMAIDNDCDSQARSGQVAAPIDRCNNVQQSSFFGINCCKPKGALEETSWHCHAMPVCGMTPRIEVPTPRLSESFEFRPYEELLETVSSPQAKGNSVVLHLYDLNSKLAAVNRVTYDLLGAGGAFHASVEVCGLEWSFGSRGINRSLPRQRWQELYRQSVFIGKTACSKTDVAVIIRDMEADEWKADNYDVLMRNCGAFADALCVQLNVGHIPAWVNRFAEASVSSTTWRKVASYLGCESSALQIDARCQQQDTSNAFSQPAPRVGCVKTHPVPRLAMNHLGENKSGLPECVASKSRSTGLSSSLRCPLADRTNQFSLYPDSPSRSPYELKPDCSPEGPTPSKMFVGRRCRAFALDYDTHLAECDLNRGEVNTESGVSQYADGRIILH